MFFIADVVAAVTQATIEKLEAEQQNKKLMGKLFLEITNKGKYPHNINKTDCKLCGNLNKTLKG
jgi:hypothetical protein